jgi:hypothetical protein
LAIVQKRPKTIKSDQNGRALSTVLSKSAQKRRAQFNILAPEPLWRYQEGRSDPKKAPKSALVDHPSVAEAAVVGIPHDIKGQAIVAFVTLKDGKAFSPEVEADLKEHVVRKIGPIARPETVIFSADLPKTRSGEIMRRLLRDIGEEKTLSDTTTLADASADHR